MSTINTVSLKIAKSPRGPVGGVVAVDLFCRHGWSPIADCLETVGFDYRQAGNAFKVYAGGATLFHTTKISSTLAGKPFVRQDGERVSAWLDRCSGTASGIGIEVPITEVIPSQLEHLLRLVAVSDKFNYKQVTSEWLALYRGAQKPTDTAIETPVEVEVEVIESTVSVPTDHNDLDLSAMTVKQLKELWKSKAPKSWGSFPRSARRPIEVLLETLI